MALNSYLQETQRLLNDQSQKMVNPADLTVYINRARRQVAGDFNCIRAIGTLSTVAATQVYNFSGISLSSVTGAGSVYNIRTIWAGVASGQVRLRPRSWPWFSLYELNNPIPTQGMPKVWSQFAQGINGSIYFSPIPDAVYVVKADATCMPSDILTETDADAIPQPWADVVPYYAAYLAYLELQRPEVADKMLGLYENFAARARSMSTPTILPHQYEQGPKPVRTNQLGLGKIKAGMT